MDTTEHVNRSDPTPGVLEHEKREAIGIVADLGLGFFRRSMPRRVFHVALAKGLAAWSGARSMRKRIAQRLSRVAARLFPIAAPPPVQAQDVGRLVTLLAQLANARLTERPAALADFLDRPLRDFIKATDFGEVKELCDRAEDTVVETVRRVMDFIWNTYPAKLGSVMSIAHPLSNTTVRALKEIVTPLNSVSPDLLADLLLTIVGGIDGRQVGQLANALLEMARQLHTGSLLQGESGVPQFQKDLTRLLREIMSNIDPELLGKVNVIVAENAEERSLAKSAVMEENPALVLGRMERLSAVKNPRLRAVNRRVQVYENLSRDGLPEAVVNGLTELDTQTLAETCNAVLRIFNQVHTEKPEFFMRLLENVFMNIDEDELKTAVTWLKQDVIEGLRPISGEVFPILAEALNELNEGR